MIFRAFLTKNTPYTSKATAAITAPAPKAGATWLAKDQTAQMIESTIESTMKMR